MRTRALGRSMHPSFWFPSFAKQAGRNDGMSSYGVGKHQGFGCACLSRMEFLPRSFLAHHLSLCVHTPSLPHLAACSSTPDPNPTSPSMEPQGDSLSKGRMPSHRIPWGWAWRRGGRHAREMARDADAALNKAIRACSEAQESMARGRMARGKEAQVLLKSLRELVEGCDAMTEEVSEAAIAAVDEGRDPAESTVHWILQAQRGKGKRVAMESLRDALLEEAEKEYPRTHQAYLDAKRGHTRSSSK